MDYRKLAEEFITSSFSLSSHMHYRNFNEISKGESFVLQLLMIRGVVLSNDIATAMNISTARVASILNKLEEKGLVTRQIDESDHRRVIVMITKSGKEKAASQKNHVLDKMEELLSELGENDAKEFVRIFEKIKKININHK